MARTSMFEAKYFCRTIALSTVLLAITNPAILRSKSADTAALAAPPAPTINTCAPLGSNAPVEFNALSNPAASVL